MVSESQIFVHYFLVFIGGFYLERFFSMVSFRSIFMNDENSLFPSLDFPWALSLKTMGISLRVKPCSLALSSISTWKS